MNRRFGGAGIRRVIRAGARLTSSFVDTIPSTTPSNRWRADTGVVTGATMTWTDSIGGRVVSQSTGANQPTVASASELRGTAVLDFPSSTHALVSADAASVWTALHGPHTHYVIGVPRSVTTGRIFSTRNSSSTASTSAGVFVSLLSSSNSVRWAVGNGTANPINAIDVASAYADDGAGFWMGSWSDAAYRLDSNLVAASTGVPAAALGAGAPQATLTIGGGAIMAIAEVIFWNRVLTADERSTVETYISGRYGVAA